LLDSLLQEMSSDELYKSNNTTVSSLSPIRDVPAWAAIMIAFGVAAVGSCVLLVIICIVCKAKHRKSVRISEAHRAIAATSEAFTMRNLSKTNSQMIIISEADSTVNRHDDSDDIDDGPVDFLSVRDLNVTRYNSAKDLQSLSTYRSVNSVDDSVCSRISDRSWLFKQESYNPTPNVKLNFEECTNENFATISKESLTTLSTFKTASSETLKAGTEFWVIFYMKKKFETWQNVTLKNWNLIKWSWIKKLSCYQWQVNFDCNVAIGWICGHFKRLCNSESALLK